MADPRFHHRTGPYKLAVLADMAGAELSPGSDPDFLLEDVAPLDQAAARDISFLDNVKYKDAFAQTKAGACIVTEAMADAAPAGTALLFSANPYKSYALIAQTFYPEHKPASSIAASALVDETAVIGEGSVIEPGVVVQAGAEIGVACYIEANAVIGPGVVLGEGCRVGANASISHSLIGNHVRIYPGCRIGQDGFGFAIDPAGHVKVPQLGRVIIHDGVEIGANTTIDRGAGPDTEIGAGTWIDNLVQIAHNVKIGRGCVIVAQVGISGSTVLEDYVVLAGQTGIAGHLKIGKGARIAAQSGVMKDVPPGEEQMGSPALPRRETLKQVALLRRLVQKKGQENK